MIPKFSDAVTIDWERRDLEFKTVLTVRFCASMQYHIEDGDEVEYEKVKDFVVEQLRLEVANSVGGMLATAERETLERRIDELCAEVERLKQQNVDVNGYVMPPYSEYERLYDENAKLREYAAKAWSLFIRHGAVHACDLSEVDAVRDGLRELGVDA